MRIRLSATEIRRKAVMVTPYKKVRIHCRNRDYLIKFDPLVASGHLTIDNIHEIPTGFEADLVPSRDFNVAAFADIAGGCLSDIIVE